MRAQLLFLIAAPLCAQTISIGGKIGIPFSDPLGPYADSARYAAGPSVEVRLPAGFAVEASAIYRTLRYRFSYNFQPENGSGSVSGRARGNAWEFPLIGKYYFGGRESSWNPFLGTGWSLRTIGWNYDGVSTTTTAGAAPATTPFQTSRRSSLNAGATFATGVRFRAGRISILPEIRYTRWGGVDTTRRNEGAFFLGFRF